MMSGGDKPGELAGLISPASLYPPGMALGGAYFAVIGAASGGSSGGRLSHAGQ